MQRNHSTLKKLSLAFIFTLVVTRSFAQYPDTTTVQAFTFGGPQDKMVGFPDGSVQYQKVLMLYTLKCVPGSNPSCGQWDYLTYTYLFHPTGKYDSTLLTQANYTVNQTTPDSLPYINTSSYSVYPHWEYHLHYLDTTSSSSFTLGTGATNTQEPFNTADADVKAQYIWTASELTAAGLDSGWITHLKFNITTAGSELRNFTVRMKQSSLDSITNANYENAGLTQVYRATTTFNSGWNTLILTTPFHWDGLSNIVVDLCFDRQTPGGAPNINTADDPGYKAGIIAMQNDYFLEFHNADYVDVPASAFANIDSQITISFWQYGDTAFQPQNQSSFEGLDSNNFRVVNAHVPWSDATVYWDCGNSASSSYDRVQKAANSADYEGHWTYWTFTKDAQSGLQRIYKNGVLWLSGSNLHRTMSGITKFRIASFGNGTDGFYDGMINEFTVWNTALDAATIQAWMNKDIDSTHPMYNSLQLYYKFDEQNGVTVLDYSGNGNNGTLNGLPARKTLIDCQNIRNIQNTQYRPQIEFDRIAGNTVLDSTLVMDTVPNAPLSVIIYNNINNPGSPTDTIVVWNNYNIVYDINGNVFDTVWVNADSTLHKTETQYYSAPFEVMEPFQIARYITPYGIGLDLGNGFTWVYDVTDYLPLLKDTVRMNAGNWQELLDVKFLFIHGAPDREIKRVENVYNTQVGYNSGAESVLTPKTFHILPGEQTYRMKMRTTGHGFGGNENCSEFCEKVHHISINNLVDYFSDDVFRNNCDENPLYPQGGTWLYERTNWCPGGAVWTKDYELTQFVTSDSFTVDYNLQPGYTWNGQGSGPYWDISSQVVFYGDYNFQNDVGMGEIIAPSTGQIHGRYNPICGQPIVTIKNEGSNTLTSCDIAYGVDGGKDCYYTWTGSLEFNDTAQVTLPAFDWNGFDQANPVFHASVSWPNGVPDENQDNNWVKSNFALVPEYDSVFIVQLRTNLAAFENSWKIFNDADSMLYFRNGFSNSTTYYDTVHLKPGCYRFEFYDMTTDGDGLSFFANSDGNGSLKFKKDGGPIFKTFQADFGSKTMQEFTVGYPQFASPAKDSCIAPLHNSVEQVSTNHAELNIYPNPSTGKVAVNFNLNAIANADLSVTNSLGQLIFTQHFEQVNHKTVPLNLVGFSKGIYFITLRSGNNLITGKLVLTNE